MHTHSLLNALLVLITLIFSASSLAFAKDDYRLLVGTYTGQGSYGVYSLTVDPKNGKVTMLDSLAMVNPSFLSLSADKKMIYAVSEQSSADASVSAIRFSPQSGRMSLVNTLQTDGADPCFVETNGKMVLTANYTGGSMSVFSLNADGSLRQLEQLVKGTTGGTHANQQTAHIHTARFVGGQEVMATDFSADRFINFSIDGDTLRRKPFQGIVAPGAGPRHLEFSHDSSRIYAINELGGTVTLFKRNDDGSYQHQQTVASDSVDGGGCADIHLSPDGKYLYASNRLKADGISIFKVDKDYGTLKKVGYQLTGIHPRNFAITPDGRYLFCACRDSHAIEIFRINKKTGMLTPLPKQIRISMPVCIRFY